MMSFFAWTGLVCVSVGASVLLAGLLSLTPLQPTVVGGIAGFVAATLLFVLGSYLLDEEGGRP